jgi:CheY-like chemotaxis protein
MYPEPVGLRVVLAAASPVTAVQMGVLLGNDGHDVRLALDGTSALEAAEAHDPDVLLLEGGLPGMDVHEVARRLKRRNALKTPLLIEMSWQDACQPQAADADIDLHLDQPVDPVLLQRLLRRFQRVVH